MKTVLKRIALLVLLVNGGVLSAANYYVSTSGNNTQAGTESNPWKTIKHAINKVSAGDIVYVKAGEYYEQLNINKNGNVSLPIIFKGVGNPVIRNGSNNVRLSGKHLVFDGFEVRNTNESGIVISGSDIEVKNCIIHDHSGSGVLVLTSTNITISGGEIYNNNVGLTVGGKATNLLFDGIDIYSTGGSNGKQKAGIKAWNGGGTTNWVLTNLKIHDHPAYGAEIMPSSSARLYDVFMTDCHFYNNGIGAPASIPGITFRAANLLIQRVTNGTLERNIFERGMGWGVDIYTSNKYKVFNNLFLNNYDSQNNPVGPGFGLEINASDETEVYNNTFYGNETAFLISYLYSGHDWPPGKFRVSAHNNIFYQSRKRDYLELLDTYADQTTITMSNNLMNTNPQFVNPGAGDFHLKPNSPAIDAGKTVNVPFDYDGVARPQGSKIDLGMFEYCTANCGGITGPDGYIYSTTEQGVITISDVPYDIAYGNNGTYSYLTNQMEDVPCTNEQFGGDPLPGVVKHCFIKESKVSYLGMPTSIPGIIMAENYDFGGQGVSYSDNDPTNNGAEGSNFRINDGVDIGLGSLGNVVGWTEDNEWLEYTVDVESNGKYQVEFFVASPNGGGMVGLDFNGDNLMTGVEIPQTSGWDSYTSFKETTSLTEGQGVLRVNIEKSGFNLGKLEITKLVTTGVNDSQSSFTVFPNPSESGVFKLSTHVKYQVFDTMGNLVLTGFGMSVNLVDKPKGAYILQLGEKRYQLIH